MAQHLVTPQTRLPSGDKKYYRHIVKQRLQSFSNSDKYLLAQQDIRSQLLAIVSARNKSDVIALYSALPLEADCSPLIPLLWQLGFGLALPQVLSAEEMVFIEITPLTRYTRDKFGIETPESGHRITPHVIMVPCLGFNSEGYRLGRGKGYYDRVLHGMPTAFTVGVAFSVGQVPFNPDSHDVALQKIVCEQEEVATAQKIN